MARMKNKDAFWKKERGMALNISELAEVTGQLAELPPRARVEMHDKFFAPEEWYLEEVS
jgi:hypothetical protein